MPPLLSSLATALLFPRRRATPMDRADLFSLDIASLQQHRSAHNDYPSNQPHPAAAMAVTYSLFLLGLGNHHPPDHPHHTDLRIPHLPVRLDLNADHPVRAYHDPSVNSSLNPLPLSTPTASSSTKISLSLSPTSSTAFSDSSPPDAAEHYHQYTHLARASNLRDGPRHITIVTTAAMPWMTGTSVNPALRAIYLAKDNHFVTLVVPWLDSLDEQRHIFSKGSPTFNTKCQQADYIHNWAQSQVPDIHFDILFYNGVYANNFGSIMPVGAITDVFASNSFVADVCILEEPEHLTWHHAGKVWSEIFNIVVGIIHTNYIEYTKNNGFFGPQKALAMLFLNKWVCRGYCHRIIKLSDAVQAFPNSITSNVHGVRDKFIQIGRNRSGPFPHGAYFLGKVLWAKGYRELIDNMTMHYQTTGTTLPIDFFGTGPEVEEVQQDVNHNPALSAVTFHATVADPTSAHIQGYKLFVNASSSDVVCTATAEALAMGKLVVCLEHSSNEFFATFPNCITYRTVAEFSSVVTRALEMEPKPLSKEDAYRLTWEAATERLYDATRLPLSRNKASKVDLALGNAHFLLSKIYPQPGKGIQNARSKQQKQQRKNAKAPLPQAHS